MRSLRCVLLAAALAAGIPFIEGFRHGRTIDGVDTDIREAPWLVQIEYAELTPPFDLNVNASCSGSIINNRQILTAAHCFPEGNYRQYATKVTRVRVGATEKHGEGAIYTIESLEIHPDHKEGDSLDVCVLTLVKEIEFSDTIQAIPFITQKPADGSALRAGGWGVSSRTELEFHTQLKTVSLTLRDHDNCTGFLERAPLDAYNNEAYICLDGVDGITGSGDSGCGLWIREHGRAKLVGVLKGGWTERNLDLFVDINKPVITSFLEKTVIGYAEARQEEAKKEAAEKAAAEKAADKDAKKKKSDKKKYGKDRFGMRYPLRGGSAIPAIFGWLPPMPWWPFAQAGKQTA